MTITRTATGRLLDPIALSALRRRFVGELLTPDTPAYGSARRLANARLDRRPALIARAHNPQDVAAAVIFAREHGLPIAVCSRGHSVPGHSTGEGALLIDLSQLKQLSVAPDRRSARVQPGVTNGELVLALGDRGLATTTGTSASVGVGGSACGGGIGWLTGRFGATVDNVLAFEIVTADGQIRTASADKDPDLFWALRGGANFGVVTNITYRLHPLGPVLGGTAVFPLAAAPLALRMYRQLIAGAPDGLLAHVEIADAPEIGPALSLKAVYSGADLAAGEGLLAPIRRFGPPAIDRIARRSYAEAYTLLAPALPPGAAWSETAYTLRQLSDAALDDLVATAFERPSALSRIAISQFHGAAARVAPGATGLALRGGHLSVVNVGMWLEGSGEAETTWTWRAKARMAPYASPSLHD